MIANYILVAVSGLVNIYYFAMLFYIISSWIPPLRENALGRFVEKIVNPYLDIFRKVIPPIGMIDISPIVAFFVYGFITRYLLEGVRFILITIGV